MTPPAVLVKAVEAAWDNYARLRTSKDKRLRVEAYRLWREADDRLAEAQRSTR
jgi:hypothetical protein